MKLVQKPAPANSLAYFDLDDAAIATIVRDAHSERSRITGNAPSNAAGSTFYIWFVSGLRKHLLGLGRGWANRNVNGLEVVEHAEKRVRIAYLSAEGTSGEDMKSSPRGPMSIAAAERNQQLLPLPAIYFERTRSKTVHPSMLAVGFKTWFFAIERDGDVYRGFLALPTETEAGRFVNWEQPIRFADVPIDSEPKNDKVEPPAAAETTTPAKPRRRQKAAPVGDIAKTGTNSKDITKTGTKTGTESKT